MLKKETKSKLTSKSYVLRSSDLSNKKKRPGKPWWNDTLSKMWNEVCTAEKAWLKC
jgi:hypothetical protein